MSSQSLAISVVHVNVTFKTCISSANMIAQVLQREVEIEVESMDKGGNFIGYLFTKEGNENLSELLVRCATFIA